MARYQVILAYDGSGFAGSQRQAKKRTVQGELESALGKLGWSDGSVLLAGRTDTGVHASGQVAAFDLTWRHTESDLQRALNSTLPFDLAVGDVRIVPGTFHPRFDASSRRYRYRLFCQPVRNPLRERYAWRTWPKMDGGALQEVAVLFQGCHDFAAYGSPSRPGGKTERTVMQTSWKQQEDEWQFEVEADAFLYRMVRRLVFIQIAVARGKITIETVAHSLISPLAYLGRNILPAGIAPAHGLTLVEVFYPPEKIWSV